HLNPRATLFLHAREADKVVAHFFEAGAFAVELEALLGRAVEAQRDVLQPRCQQALRHLLVEERAISRKQRRGVVPLAVFDALEVAPAIIGMAALTATYRRFPFTNLVYGLIFIHSLILMLGGHYTYAKAPLGFWMQHIFHFSRNHYDRIGHFAQGFVPAMIAR